MVDVEPQVAVHGSESHVILHVFGQKTAVHHVEAKSIVQLDVHVAHQCRPHSLGKSQSQFKGSMCMSCLVYSSYSTYRGQLIPGVIAWCEHCEGASAFNFPPQA